MSVLLVGFVAVQILFPETAMIPPRILKSQRSAIAGLWSTTCIGASQYIYGKTAHSAYTCVSESDHHESLLPPNLVPIH